MMRAARRLALLLLACALGGVPSPAEAQARGPWGRIAFSAQSFTATEEGRRLPGFTELVFATTFASPTRDQGGTEYRFDFRGAGYPQAQGRSQRVSIYDAYVGQRLAGGALGVRVGQMWLNDLGGLGSLGGGLVEVVRPNVLGLRQLRIGGFGGLEPKILVAGYVSQVVKAGGYVTLEGNGAWRNTVGFVTLRHSGLTERSVLTTTNFLPFGKRLLVYQAAEIDLVGPAGQGQSGLTYFFTNARYSPIAAVELQGIYHRGRSIDTRGITLDTLNGRPVSAQALEGLLYASAGGRVTVTAGKHVRVFAGYTRDRNNREDAPTTRLTLGGFTSNLLRTGIDVRVSDARVRGPNISYDAWDVSAGRNLGARLYLSADYSSSLSAFRLLGQDAFAIETRPRTTRVSASGLVRLTRRISLLVSGDRTRDGTYTDLRWMSTFVYRF